MKRKTNQYCSSFTVLELLLYMGILSILLYVVTQTFVSVVNYQLESEAASSVDQDSRFLLARLTYDIKRAKNINLPANLGETGNVLQIIIDGAPYTYQLNNANVELTNNFGTDKLNSRDTNVQKLLFTRLGNARGKQTIKIELTVASKAQLRSEAEIKNWQMVVGTR